MLLHPLVKALQDEIPEDLRPYVSIESLIDRATSELIGTLFENGSWTEKEKADYDALCDERIERMTPPSFKRLEKLLESREQLQQPVPRQSLWQSIRDKLFA
jgi:hypothetical protein